MAIVKGLASIKRHQTEQEAKRAAGGKDFPQFIYKVFPKVVGNEIVGRFLQELDVEADNYREDRGVGFIAVEHEAGAADKDSDKPKTGFMFHALCTMDDEGQCYGCERHKNNYKGGWNIKQNLYINFLTEIDGEKKVFVVSRSANSSFVQSLIQEAVDEGSITDANYRITKTGEGTTTQWLLKRLKTEPLDDTDVTLWDLDNQVIKDVPYAEQAAFYGQAHGDRVQTSKADSVKSAPSAATADDEW